MTTVSKADYLKKYLSGNGASSDAKKKKKAKTKSTTQQKRIRIVDEDLLVPLSGDMNAPSATAFGEHFDESDSDDDQPVIEFVDQPGREDLKMLGRFKSDTFKTVDDKKPAPRRARHDSSSDDDVKTTKKFDKAKNADDMSPPRRRRHDSDDNSPPRNRRNNAQQIDSDASPPRRRNNNEGDQSPVRKRHRRDSDNDTSPPRRARHASPPSHNSTRSSTQQRHVSPPRKLDTKNDDTNMVDGKLTGLQSAQSLREESERRKKAEKEALKTADDFSNAKTVFRDKATGRRRNLNEEKVVTEEELRKQKELEDKYKLWNKGVRQLKERESKLNEMAEVIAQPLARYEGDAGLEKHLKAQELRDDPMLEYMQKKQVKVTKAQVYPKYTGRFNPNRYAILPGYRWDGVDRTNGFEKKLMSTRNDRAADQEEYYKWTSGTYE